MFAPGDRVVCIRQPPRLGQVTLTDYVDVVTLPQVGCVYTVYSVHVHPIENIEGIALEEMPCEAPSGKRWIFEAHYFRKVVDFEEPRRKVTEAPKELELV